MEGCDTRVQVLTKKRSRTKGGKAELREDQVFLGVVSLAASDEVEVEEDAASEADAAGVSGRRARQQLAILDEVQLQVIIILSPACGVVMAESGGDVLHTAVELAACLLFLAKERRLIINPAQP
ncbi:hypothetical protein E2562_011687 [Oryza meyeriana var. granulata]|uniref:Uncharacterized protein n=1 Tax=Oryza meyeriana var. granulata TaxID=110450 RepID=A0A6G1DGQ9_9ORYZ|nr:hypothetical protein E2562_011687 [Oryza meyeriana var. granulata]